MGDGHAPKHTRPRPLNISQLGSHSSDGEATRGGERLEQSTSSCPLKTSPPSFLPRLQEALPVVFKRFSDSCEVVSCILEFYKEMAAAERRYSTSISKLMESASYNFHSNILMQWLGSDPFEEIG